MLRVRPGKGRQRLTSGKSRVGLALAGGGPIGAVYEIGALLALDDALDGVNFTELDVYVGVSSGGFIAAGLANELSPAELYRVYVDNTSPQYSLSPEVLLQPALREYYTRAMSAPGLVVDFLWRYLSNPLDRGLMESMQQLGRAIPAGIFDNGAVGEFLQRVFTGDGRSNDFRKLKHRLYLVATDLDTSESVEFGAKGYDHVPISTAVQASAALPGLFPPVEINGRYYVDGALNKTLHASAALRDGANLVFCINPLVPFDARLAVKHGKPKHEALVKGGLPLVLSQTFRALIHSRMRVGMAQYDSTYKGADIVLLEPDSDDAEMFFTNVFSYAKRRSLCEHAYQRTIHDLALQSKQLAATLAGHGISLRHDVISQSRPHTSSSPSLRALHPGRIQAQLSRTLSDLQQWLISRGVALPRMDHV